LPTEFPAVKAHSKATAEPRTKALGRAPAARRTVASAGMKIAQPTAKGAVWDDDSRFSQRLSCYAMIESAHHVERTARAALALLEREDPSKAQKEACKRWLGALARLRGPLGRFVDKQPWRYGQAVVTGIYECATRLLRALAQDFRERRSTDRLAQFAEDVDLASAVVDALVRVVDDTIRDVLPGFAPLRKDLVEWLVDKVAPENACKIDYEHGAQAMAAKLVRLPPRKVQDIVGRSRKYEAIEAPFLFSK
jgi:hypothetical protein